MTLHVLGSPDTMSASWVWLGSCWHGTPRNGSDATHGDLPGHVPLGVPSHANMLSLHSLRLG